MENFENNIMKNAINTRRELRERKSYFSLLESARKNIEEKESNKLLTKTPDDVFDQMNSNN
jgi:uncharacterized membrane protein